MVRKYVVQCEFYNIVIPLSGIIILLYITHANIPVACVKNK